MGKNILILVGSEVRGGNSDILSDVLIESLEEHADIERIKIADLVIAGCNGCERCWSNGKECIIEDQMNEIYKRFLRADVLILVTPLYFYTFPAQIKAAIDRLYPYFKKEGPHQLKRKQCMLIVHGGTKKKERFAGIRTTYNIFVQRHNWINAGILCVHGLHKHGEIADEWRERVKMLGKALWNDKGKPYIEKK